MILHLQLSSFVASIKVGWDADEGDENEQGKRHLDDLEVGR